MNLADRVQQLADLAGDAHRHEEFTRAYVALFGEMQSALLLMQKLAQAQVTYLRMHTGQRVRDN